MLDLTSYLEYVKTSHFTYRLENIGLPVYV